MGKFEEQLLGDLMREHGPQLSGTERPKKRSNRPAWVATGIALAGGVAAAFLMVPAESPAPLQNLTAAPVPQRPAKQADKPAYEVIENADGTVTIAVDNLSAVDALNKELADKNIPTTGVRCIQVGQVTVPPTDAKLLSIDELIQRIKATHVKVTSDSDGKITLYAAKCD